jgi:hypothetical protein
MRKSADARQRRGATAHRTAAMQAAASLSTGIVDMPRFASTLALALAASSLAACVTPNSRSNQVVLTGNQAVVAGCSRIGVVEGAPVHRGILLRDQARDAIILRLKLRTAEMGGTHVIAAVADPKWPGTDSSGTAFRCSA